LLVSFEGFGWSRSLWDAEVLTALAIVGVILIAAWRVRKSEPLIPFFISWYFLVVLPESSLFPLSDAVNGYRAYPGNVGLSVVFVTLAAKTSAYLSAKVRRGVDGDHKRLWPRVGFLLFGLILFALTLSTLKRNLDWRDEETLWRDVLRKDPSSSRALMNLGIHFLQQQNYKNARVLFDQAIELRPTGTYGFMLRGYLNKLVGQNSAALSDYNASVQYGPRNSRAYFYRAEYFAQSGKYDEALADYEHSIGLAPNYVDALYGAASLYMKRDRVTVAEDICNKILAIDFSDPRGYQCLGSLLQSQQRLIEAVELYKRGTKLNPNDHYLWYSLGLAYEAIGSVDQARAALENAIFLKHGRPKNYPAGQLLIE
jgi:tetratricopeptide (TPR) repeat protein